MPNFLTVTQAAEALSLTRRAILHRISVGTLKAEKIGSGRTSAYVIDVAEVERVRSAA